MQVRDSEVQRVQRLRQEDEDGGGGSFAETGQYLGQIIQGALGGDLAPIFAGSVKFIEEPTAQTNLGNFLGSIAPALNLVFREMYNRAQVALGLATTPKAVSPTPMTGIPILDYDEFANSTVIVQENENGTIFVGNMTTTSQRRKQQLQPAKPTTSWEYVLNRIHASTTTVEPLPFLNIRSTPSGLIDEDDEEGVVFFE